MGSRGQSSTSSNGASRSMSASVADWYKSNFPSDALGDDINGSVSFSQALKNMSKYYDLFPSDSVIRERVFEELSKRSKKPYNEIYNEWLKNA